MCTFVVNRSVVDRKHNTFQTEMSLRQYQTYCRLYIQNARGIKNVKKMIFNGLMIIATIDEKYDNVSRLSLYKLKVVTKYF